MITHEEVISVGKLQKTHALKGELNMISDVDPQYYIDGNPLILDYEGILVPFYAETIRPKGSMSYLVKLSGVDREEEARHFVNHEVFMLKKDAPEWLEDGTIDSDSLIGFKIIDLNTGNEIGIVEDIDDSTVNLLFVVKNAQGEELFIPANDDFIEDIDEDFKLIRMRLPEGLLDINMKE